MHYAIVHAFDKHGGDGNAISRNENNLHGMLNGMMDERRTVGEGRDG